MTTTATATLKQVPIIDIAPFTHVPKYPDIVAGPLLWLSGVAVVLLAAGFAGFRRRDLGRS